jgi:signal transduction histidine kinase/HPt (histidine-containing phosphotransfer) domain-containing protein/ActR/RegA family two-component response regulator
MRFGFSLDPYPALMIVAALVSLLIGAKAWYGTRKYLARSFALLETAVFVWSLFAIVRWLAPSLDDQIEALQLEYLGIAVIPGAVYLFARAISNRPAKLLETLLILFPGIAFFAVVETNELHHMFWVDQALAMAPFTPRVAWGFWVFSAYSYAQISVAFFVVLKTAASARGLVAHWMRIFCALFAFPFVANIVFVFFFLSVSPFDPAPIFFALSGFGLSFFFGRYNFLDVFPYEKNILIEALNTPLLVVDDDGYIVAVKDLSLSLSKEAQSIEGHVFSSIFPALGGMIIDGEAQVLSRGGVDYLVSCHGVKRGRGRWQTKIYAFQDISALAAIKREVEEARAKAEAANAAKSAFIATLSHELRNPLNVILGLADLNLRSGASAEMRDDLEAILSSGTIILSLVNDLLDLSKIEAGKMELERSDFDLHEKAVSILRAFRPAAEEKGLILDIVIEVGTPRFVNGDSLRYGQILMNLVSNAVKFTERGAVIVTLGPFAEGALVLTTVRDTGMGIAADKMPLIFREFTQADSSISRRFGGTGLGLSVCKQLVALFGGELRVSSAPGKGSAFSFTVRFEKGSAAEERLASQAAGVVATGRSLRVLVVDDDPVNTAVAQRYIRHFGHSSLCAGTGAAALELVADWEFDLVLLDLGLPDMDGFDACARMRLAISGRPGGGPLIAAMTARAESGLRAACASAGMIDCLAKPIDPSGLELLLERVATQVPARSGNDRAGVESGAPIEPGAPSAPFIDMDALLERLDGDETFMCELLGIFVGEAAGRQEAFMKAADAHDIQALHKQSHALKGSSLSLCAAPLAVASGALEAACINAEQVGGAGFAAFSSVEAYIKGLVILLGDTVIAAKAILNRR